ncbi:MULTISPECIES: flagellar basal body rod protein FlgB [unclassified Acidovorax]|uniref:flagellar basal body rod protein FlgB n=1 Tax=unclassified Acidovorax TaxID=2684926 RepID=UPI0010EC6087|nr:MULTISPECIES: flagellar basal body rod protein FlgB [unclassified Acidovorax]RYF68435.1 MAG: flagellar basal body rod protein FlgB [Comamonadaceae bacterium]
MLDKMTDRLDFHGNALLLRSERQRAIASNIANADTPGYVARDFKFADALREVTGASQQTSLQGAAPRQQGTTDPRHIPLPAASTGSLSGGTLGYSVQTQPSLDNNTVDMDRERAAFVDNAVRYEATLRFINGNAKTMLSAIQGQ